MNTSTTHFTSRSAPLSAGFLRRYKVLLLVLPLLLALILIGCGSGSGNSDSATATPAVKIGSKDFTENLILGELYAIALEDHGIPVQRRLGLASSVVHETLLKGDVDLYPEYTGTGLLTVLKLPLETDPQKVYDTVKQHYAEQFDVTWLAAAPANDGQGLVVTRKAADIYAISNISELQRAAHKLRFASQGEFDVREDALPRLEEVYDSFDFLSSDVYDNALKYDVLRSGKADAAPAYTTEGQLTDPAFVLLPDDKQAWPPYNIAPVIRNDALAAYPQIAALLDAISADLTTEAVTKLNAQVDVEGREYTDVAREYYESIKAKLPAK